MEPNKPFNISYSWSQPWITTFSNKELTDLVNSITTDLILTTYDILETEVEQSNCEDAVVMLAAIGINC